VSTLLVAAGRTCDRSCYDATGPDCDCVCAGVNHGAGRERALAQALLMPDVVVLPELPLRAGGLRPGAAPGRSCVRCGGQDRLRAYREGLVCIVCRYAALGLLPTGERR
jgi:hypothetical protein